MKKESVAPLRESRCGNTKKLVPARGDICIIIKPRERRELQEKGEVGD